jgi:hypothetical protein
MDKYKHTDPLVLQSAELTERTPLCPEDQAIAEYFDGPIPEQERLNLERHLADCRYCLARIGMLNRLQDDSLTVRVPEDALAAAKSLARKPASRRFSRAPAWAAAAVVLLGVLFIAVKQPGNEPEIRQLRSIDPPESRFEVKMPGPGRAISIGAPIRWTEFPDGSHYTVHVLSDAGDVLWTEHLQSNEWVVQPEMGLNPEGDFFFRVEAELPDGRTLSSKHLAFRITER